MSVRKIGVLTGGGDAPGLNAVIRGVVRKGINTHGHSFVGFRYGWAGLLDDNLIYQNVGLPTIRGRARAVKLFEGTRRPSFGFDVKFHKIAADGATVLTERTDILKIGPVRGAFWVCGTFEVHDGRITLWRDRFDWIDVLSSYPRGLVRKVLGRARR